MALPDKRIDALDDFLFHKIRLIKTKNVVTTETFILLSSTTKFFNLV